MLRVVPKALAVSNFKCLRDVRVPLTKVNVVIGPNGSGKSGLVEALYLLKLILSYVQGRVVNPFLYWWSYRDVVWRHDERLSIGLSVELEVAWRPEHEFIRRYLERGAVEVGHVEYGVVVSGRGGRFSILEERLAVRDLGLELVCRRGECTASYRGEEYPVEEEKPPFRYLIDIPLDGVRVYGEWGPEVVDDAIEYIDGNYVLVPRAHMGYSRHVSAALVGVYALIHDMVVVFPEASFKAREPARVTRVEVLSPWGEDLAALIMTRYGGRVPESVRSSLAYILDSPGIDVCVKPTTDGRVFIEVVEEGVPLNPPSIPAGLLKALILEVALDVGSPLIVVDELENSLHVRAVHRILDDVRSSGSVLVATTHSPTLIDLVSPGEVVVMERRGLEAQARRLSDPEALARRLRELGVTLSEYLAYVA